MNLNVSCDEQRCEWRENEDTAQKKKRWLPDHREARESEQKKNAGERRRRRGAAVGDVGRPKSIEWMLRKASIDITFNHLNTACRSHTVTEFSLTKHPHHLHTFVISIAIATTVVRVVRLSPNVFKCATAVLLCVSNEWRTREKEEKKTVRRRLGMWLAFYLQIIIFHQYFRFVRREHADNSKMSLTRIDRHANNDRFILPFIPIGCLCEMKAERGWKTTALARAHSLSHRPTASKREKKNQQRKKKVPREWEQMDARWMWKWRRKSRS